MRLGKPAYMVALVVAGATVAFVSLGSHESGASPDGRIAYTPDLSHQVSLAPGADPRGLLTSIVRGYGGQSVVSAFIESPPSVPGMRRGSWLHFVVKAPSDGVPSIRPLWEADLIEGAVADRFANAPTGPGMVVGSSVDAQLPDGTVHQNVGGGMGDIVPGQNFSNASASAIRQRITNGLQQAGLTLVSLDLLRADQPAPAVVAETSDPKRAAAEAATIVRALFGQSPVMYEGYYFEIRDTLGAPVLVQSASFRTGAGRLWVSPSVEDVSSLHHF